MQVKWKVLFSFGVAFWSAMCFIEYVFGNILQKGEFDKFSEIEPEMNFVDETGFWYWFEFDWSHIVLWCFISMITSLGLFFLTKLAKINGILQKQEVLSETTNQIEIPNNHVKDVGTNYMEENGDSIVYNLREEIKPLTNCSNLLDAVKDFSFNLDKKEVIFRTDKRSRTSNELQESNSWKDYASLSRKYELVCNENKELVKQLAQAQKDNVIYKQNLNDTLCEKTKLLKRLESATRQIKQNTDHRQMTFDKLEEAIAFSNELKYKVQQLTRDRDDLAQKMRLLEQRYKFLQDQTGEFHQNTNSIKLPEPFKELEEDSEKEVDLSQSEVDIHKVQNKLRDLEKSLEKMRINTKTSQELKNQSENTSDEVLTNNDDTSITEESKIQKEMDDEERLNDLLNQVSVSCGNEETEEQEDISTSINKTTQEMHEPLSAIKGLRHNVISSSDTNVSTDYSSSDITISSEMESEMDFSTKSGIVSKSPAFKQFLLKVLDGSPS